MKKVLTLIFLFSLGVIYSFNYILNSEMEEVIEYETPNSPENFKKFAKFLEHGGLKEDYQKKSFEGLNEKEKKEYRKAFLSASRPKGEVLREIGRKVTDQLEKSRESEKYLSAKENFAKASKIHVEGVDDQGEVIFYTTFSEATDRVEKYFPDLMDENINFLAVWDGSHPLKTHEKFQMVSSMRFGDPDYNPIKDHATHVTGLMVGSTEHGKEEMAGIMPRASVLSFDFGNALGELLNYSVYESGERILLSNHSYGSVQGWTYIGSSSTCPGEYRYFSPSGTLGRDPNFGRYNINAEFYDVTSFMTNNHLLVVAAGNDHFDRVRCSAEDRSNGCVDQENALAGPRFVANTPQGLYCYSEGTPNIPCFQFPKEDGEGCSCSEGMEHVYSHCIPADDGASGFETVHGGASAKNILTIGALQKNESGYNIAIYSNRGPTRDGRLKPDLVEFGGPILGPVGTGDNIYAPMQGTSQATPLVTAQAASLLEMYRQSHGLVDPLSSTIKALLIHSATDMGPKGPDFTYGYGRVNWDKAKQVLKDENVLESALPITHAETVMELIPKESEARIKITLVWNDPPAKSPSVEHPVYKTLLVHDLDIALKVDGKIIYPWSLDPKDPKALAQKVKNTRDNVEVIEWEGEGSDISLVITTPKEYFKKNLTKEFLYRFIHLSSSFKNLLQTYSLVIEGADVGKIDRVFRKMKVRPQYPPSARVVHSSVGTESAAAGESSSGCSAGKVISPISFAGGLLFIFLIMGIHRGKKSKISTAH